MSKTLSHIMKVFEVARIVAKVFFILGIVGVAGCLIGAFMLPLVEGLSRLGLFSEGELKMAVDYSSCWIGAITCAGEAAFAYLAQRYCRHVLDCGTPFTFDGAHECFRLGIAAIIISFAVSLVGAIAVAIFSLLLSMDVSVFSDGSSASITTGLFLMFLSMIFKHGAELEESSGEASIQVDKSVESKN